jgi:hypothetical protein
MYLIAVSPTSSSELWVFLCQKIRGFRYKNKEDILYIRNLIMAEVNREREYWHVENTTGSTILIGDLPNVPPIRPGGAYNILRFARKQDINQSQSLIALVESGALILTKGSDFENKVIDPDEAAQAVTSVEVDELVAEITVGEEITDDTEGIILHGEDLSGEAAVVKLTGEHRNEIQMINLDTDTLLTDIFHELIKANIQLSIMTGNEINDKDIDPGF